MALARDHDKRVAQQCLRFDRRRHGAQMRDRDIDHAALELIGGIGPDERQEAQCRARRLFGKGTGERADQRDLGIFGHASGEDAGALGRVEAGAEIERRLDLLDRR